MTRYGWPEISHRFRMHDFTPSFKPEICFHCWKTADDEEALHIDRAPFTFCDICELWTVLDGLCIHPLHDVGWGYVHPEDRRRNDPMVTRWRAGGQRVGRRRNWQNPEAAALTLRQRAERGC